MNSGTASDYDYPTGVDINLKYAIRISRLKTRRYRTDNGTVGHGLAIKLAMMETMLIILPA